MISLLWLPEQHQGYFYLFVPTLEAKANRLELWFSRDLTGPYHQHRASPVAVDSGPHDTIRGAGRIVE